MLIKLLPFLSIPLASAMDLKMDETISSPPGSEHTSLSFHQWNDLPGDVKITTASEMSTPTLLNFRCVSKASFKLAWEELGRRLTHPIRVSFFDGCSYPVSGLSTVYVTLKNSDKNFTRKYNFTYKQGKRIVPEGSGANFTDSFPFNVFPLKAEAVLVSGYIDTDTDKYDLWQNGKIDLGAISFRNILVYKDETYAPLQAIRFNREKITYNYDK